MTSDYDRGHRAAYAAMAAHIAEQLGQSDPEEKSGAAAPVPPLSVGHPGTVLGIYGRDLRRQRDVQPDELRAAVREAAGPSKVGGAYAEAMDAPKGCLCTWFTTMQDRSFRGRAPGPLPCPVHPEAQAPQGPPPAEPAECGAVDEVFGPWLGPVCTKPKGHAGGHEAVDPVTGRDVSAWSDLPGEEPRILRSEQDFTEAAEAVSGVRVNFGAFTDDELRALCGQSALTCDEDARIRVAARMTCLGRALRPVAPEGA